MAPRFQRGDLTKGVVVVDVRGVNHELHGAAYLECFDMPTTGEKPGKGTYRCKKCGTVVRLDDNTDTLPPCPKCSGTEFDKIG